MKKMDTDK